MRRLNLVLSAASAVVLATTLAACSGSSGGSSDTSSAAGSGSLGPAAKLVPADLKGKTVSAVVMNNYPPSGYVNGGKLVGLNPDLLQAIAADTGLDIKIDGSSWDAMIPGLQAGRWDLMHASAIITSDRLAKFDFVETDKNYTAFITQSGSAVTVKKDSDVCGHSFSVVTGSVDADTVTNINTQVCEPSGASPATIQTFAGNDAVLLAVSSGRVDGAVVAGATVPDLLKKAGSKFVAQPFEGAPTYGGITLPKDSPLDPVILQAVKDLIANGTYKDIYDKYNSSTSMVDQTKLATQANPAD